MTGGSASLSAVICADGQDTCDIAVITERGDTTTFSTCTGTAVEYAGRRGSDP